MSCHFCDSARVAVEDDGWRICADCWQIIEEDNGRAQMVLRLRAANLIVDEVGRDQVRGEMLIRAAVAEQRAYWAAKGRAEG